MKKLIIGIALFLVAAISNAQNGLESVIIEKYYVSNAADASGSVGTLPTGSVTYRIYADMLPGYKFQALYGVPGHELKLTTTTSFFNNEDRGATNPNGISATNTRNNTVMIDSWFSVGNTASGKVGVIKTEDTDGSIGNANGILANNDASAGIAISTQDGMVAGTTNAVTFVGFTTELDVFDATSQAGNSFVTTNGSIASLAGVTGPTATNRVLIGQFTTDGTFHYELNIQIGTPTGGTQNFVAKTPVGSEISIPSLMGTVGGCAGAPAAPAAITPNVTGSVCSGATRTYTVAAIEGADLYQWTVPTGATINGYAGGNSISVTYDNGFIANGALTCKAVNGCGTSAIKSMNVIKGTPLAPAITGEKTACKNSTKTYSVVPVSGLTYSWTTAAGRMTIINGSAPNNVITVTFPSGTDFIGDSLKCKAISSSCGESIYKAFYVGPSTIPANPALTLLPNATKVCTGDAINVTAKSTGATNYSWSVSSTTGVSIYVGGVYKGSSYSGPQSTIQLSFTNFTNGAPACSLTVSTSNGCGNSAASSLKVFTTNTPVAPAATVTGGTNIFNNLPLKVCPGDQRNVSFAALANAEANQYKYTCDVPGAKIGIYDLNTTGYIGGTSATITFTNAFVTSAIKISIQGKNACGYGTAKVLTFTRNAPVKPVVLTADQGIYNNCGGSRTFTATPASPTNATSYSWSLSPTTTTASIVGTPTSTTASVSFPSATHPATSVQIQAVNTCGSSAVVKVAVKSAFNTPVINASGSKCSNGGSDVTYSVDAMAGATYSWTIPTGSSIVSGGGTNSITVHFTSVNFGGTTPPKVTAKYGNACASSVVANYIVTTGCRLGEVASEAVSFNLYPNPATEIVTIDFESQSSGTYNVSIIDATGRVVKESAIEAAEGYNNATISLTDLSKGIYMVSLKNTDHSFEKRLIVQ